MLCPCCKEVDLEERDGILDQCGQTVLPAHVRECTHCGYSETRPTGAPWRSTWAKKEEPV